MHASLLTGHLSWQGSCNPVTDWLMTWRIVDVRAAPSAYSIIRNRLSPHRDFSPGANLRTVSAEVKKSENEFQQYQTLPSVRCCSTVSRFRYTPRGIKSVLPSCWDTEYTSFRVAYIPNHNMRTWRRPRKTGSIWNIATPPKSDRATAGANIHQKLVKAARVVPEICSRTDSDTHKRTCYDTILYDTPVRAAILSALKTDKSARIQKLKKWKRKKVKSYKNGTAPYLRFF